MGKTTALGYGSVHQTIRAQLAPQVATGTVRCWRCLELIPAGAPWDLGHDDRDRGRYRGPEHRYCNRSEPGRKQRRRQSRSW